ncbi:MAG: YcxB family protein [Betaproteobacteria bacterium]|nr:YcxB family protein [Betaproteobacteria bacterium]
MNTQSVPLPLELTFDNVLTEHLAADRLYYRSTLFWKLDKIVGALLFVIGIYLIYTVGLVWWSLIWIPLGLLEAFSLLSLRPIQVRIWFKRNPQLSGTYHLSIGESGIYFRTTSIDSHVKWDIYSRFMENEALYLLIFGHRMCTVIPKRAFRTTADLETFKSLVSRNIGVKAR